MTIERYKDAGFAAWLIKPVDPYPLLMVINRVVAHSTSLPSRLPRAGKLHKKQAAQVRKTIFWALQPALRPIPTAGIHFVLPLRREIAHPSEISLAVIAAGDRLRG